MLDERTATEHKPNGVKSRWQPKPASPTATPVPRYKHILVPLTLAPDDREALILGTEIAAMHHAALTVLFIQPASSDAPSMHWLHAIDRLHQALDRNSIASLKDAADALRSQILGVFEREVPQYLREGLAVSAEVQTGDFAEMIAQYAEDASADLVIMSSGQPRWWLPVLPTPVRRAMRMTRQPVILVKPQGNGRKKPTPQALR